MPISIPVITPDFDGQVLALDQAIRQSAVAFKFNYRIDAPKYSQIYQVPSIIYDLVQHYTMRGFLVTYDGDEGYILIDWSYPNMSWLEIKEVTRSIPAMIPNLGFGFRASMVYLCMTNGVDLRGQTDISLQQKLERSIIESANLGNTELVFGYADVPAGSFSTLFKATFQLLLSKGFLIHFDPNQNLFILKWGQNFPTSFVSGDSLSVQL